MTDLLARLRITADAKEATREVAGVGREMTHLRQAGGQAKAGLDQAAAGADHLQRSAGGADRQARLLVAALAGFSIKAFASDITDAAFRTQGFNTGLTAVAGGARSAANEQAFLRTEAQRLGLVVQDQVQGFMGLAGATNGTALAGAETREIWLGLAEAGTALNRSSEQQGRALEAVSQIASKGVLSMEELRGQLSEAIPGAMQIAARSMGVTTAQLNKLVGDGKVASEDFLPKFAAELRRTFGPTLDEAMNTPLGQARKELAATKTAIFDLQSAAGHVVLDQLRPDTAETVSCHVVVEIEAPKSLGAAAELVVGDLEVADAMQTAARAVIVQLDPHNFEPSGAHRPGQGRCTRVLRTRNEEGSGRGQTP